MAIEELQARIDATHKNGHDPAPPWELVPLEVYTDDEAAQSHQDEDTPRQPTEAAAQSSMPFPTIDCERAHDI
jgi:hypothetical protein